MRRFEVVNLGVSLVLAVLVEPQNIILRNSGRFPYEMHDAADYLDMLANGDAPREMLPPLGSCLGNNVPSCS